ncbi:MAG: DUF4845 domain-containing protein [Sinobacteraceae bacterium]|nr:DUF4845 domain-containing protein [Nevskiaceae bacterium]
MRSKQTGVTLIGWIILLIPIGICVYAGIRLTPVYLNYMKVARTLEQVRSEFKEDGGTATTIRTSVEKHLNIESVDYPDIKDIKIARDGTNWVVSASYDDQAPLFANMSILVSFDKSVTLSSGANQ